MRTLEQHISPDGNLKLIVCEGNDGEIAIGFKGSTWHTHPDLLSNWLGVQEDKAVSYFITQVLFDNLPIILSTDAGNTIDPWVSDNLVQTIKVYGADNCLLRKWTTTDYDTTL